MHCAAMRNLFLDVAQAQFPHPQLQIYLADLQRYLAKHLFNPLHKALRSSKDIASIHTIHIAEAAL